VTVTSTPAGAAIWRGGTNTGHTTEHTFDKVPPGMVFYTLKLEGHDELAVSGTVEAGGRLVLAGTLKALPPSPAAVTLNAGEVGKGWKFAIGGGQEIVVRYVPGGTFTMGSPESEKDRSSDETEHRVTLSSHYWMGETEVTQGQWVAVMGSNPSHFKGDPALPVETVSWEDAQGFIKALNTRCGLPAGWKWALPSEAQWERACRGGKTTATAYGDSLSSAQANFNGNYPYGGAAKDSWLANTAPVRSYKANAYGLHDMHGNVWEWCADWHDAYPAGAATDPAGPNSGSYRVIRGGSWSNGGTDCRSAYRFRITPDDRFNRMGFRLAAVPAGH